MATKPVSKKPAAKAAKKPGDKPATIGRPAKYTDPAVMAARMDAFFDDCRQREAPPTVQGLAVFLDFESIQSLEDYAKRDSFSWIVKKAKLRIEQSWAERLNGSNATGAIFTLKCNYHWTETAPVQEVHTKHYAEGDTIKRFKGWLDE